MTQEEKQLLLTDISARLPYGIKGKLFLFGSDKHTREINIIGYTKLKGKLFERIFAEDEFDYNIEWFKPYLRPMSSMTEEELNECVQQSGIGDIKCPNWHDLPKKKHFEARLNHSINMFLVDSRTIDWLNAHHFDYRGLIPMGLALEALEGIYNT